MRSRRRATGVSRVLRARSVPGVSPRVSPKMGGVRGSVRRGVPGGLRARAPECPKSVLRVSPECPGPGTLSGHFWTLWSPLRAPGTPRRTLPRTPPIFGDTLGDTPGVLRARETPVAGRRDRNAKMLFTCFLASVLCPGHGLVKHLVGRKTTASSEGIRLPSRARRESYLPYMWTQS